MLGKRGVDSSEQPFVAKHFFEQRWLIACLTSASEVCGILKKSSQLESELLVTLTDDDLKVAQRWSVKASPINCCSVKIFFHLYFE